MLSTFSKVFEKLLFEKINDRMQNEFSKHLTGFCKNHSTQNVLLVTTEKWKAILDKKLKVGIIIMDLSKGFDTLDHSLLMEKLIAYSHDNNSLSFFQSHLTNRFQRCKTENDFSSWREITTGVPKALFSDLFFLIFLSMTFSNSLKVETFVIMPVITPYLHLANILTNLSENFKMIS